MCSVAWRGASSTCSTWRRAADQRKVQSALARARVAALAIDEAHCISAGDTTFDRIICGCRSCGPSWADRPCWRSPRRPRQRYAMTSWPAWRSRPRRSQHRPVDQTWRCGRVAGRPPGAPAGAVAAEPDAPTIVYALRQADTARLAELLRRSGLRAAAYHAGLDDDVRAEVQDRFLADEIACVVATIAFGMGVGQAERTAGTPRHAPRSLEGYWQEIRP